MSIQTAIQFTEDYINQVDSNGLSDPFNYQHIIINKWCDASRDLHKSFIELVNNAFNTTAFIPVTLELNRYLLSIQDSRIDKLKELNAPDIIIENAINFKSKLIDNTNDPHLLVSMLMVSLSIVNA